MSAEIIQLGSAGPAKPKRGRPRRHTNKHDAQHDTPLLHCLGSVICSSPPPKRSHS
jgi:hypothetical protein